MTLTRRGFASVALALGIGGCTAVGGDDGTGDGPPEFAVSFARKGGGRVEVIVDGGARMTEENTDRLVVRIDGDPQMSWSPPLDDRERRTFSVPTGGSLDVVWIGPGGQREVIEQFHAEG
ncbi:MAG: hypothetical protein V5A39_00025 [Haloarculaceae archaeon]